MSERKITEEQIREFVQRFSDRISEIDQLATAVLKSHFLVEESVDLALEAVAKCPKHLELERNPPFVRKVNWLRAFAPLGEDARWELILALNSLRNKVAHKFDGPERKKALQKLRKELTRHVLIKQLNEQEWPDYNVVQVKRFSTGGLWWKSCIADNFLRPRVTITLQY